MAVTAFAAGRVLHADSSADDPRRIYVHPVMEDGRWRIANIAYDRGEDFVSFRNKLAGR